MARAAGRSDLAGRTGFLCDPEPVTIRDFAGTVARLPPRPARLVTIPDGFVRAAALAASVSEIVTRQPRPFNADKAREILAGDWLCDSAPLRQDLRRSEEHTSELQSRLHLVCRLLLEKKKQRIQQLHTI